MALNALFTQMRKRSASNKDEDLENSLIISESDTEIQNTDLEPATKHPRMDRDSHTTESDSTSELSFSTSGMKNKKYKQNMGYKPEYKRAHWWVRYDESPGIEGMFCSICEKWGDIAKGNISHNLRIRLTYSSL